MPDTPRTDVTSLLLDLGAGTHDQKDVSDRLYQAVYRELRQVAGSLMRGERQDHTLQPTALVHEAYLRLVDQTRTEWKNRAHFFGIAARAMRQILVDHARKHRSLKRGGDRQKVTLDDNLQDSAELSFEILALHDALEKLASEDERMARGVELRIFTGMLSREVAHVMGISKRTVDEDWKVAKMWLSRELADRDNQDAPNDQDDQDEP
ncbi:MAG: sigma-70 family RNA polymerase sigma factor [bacterium]